MCIFVMTNRCKGWLFLCYYAVNWLLTEAIWREPVRGGAFASQLTQECCRRHHWHCGYTLTLPSTTQEQQ